ncbi:MAG: 3',5'-cyclic-nucleotide phosphodiesterase [Nitrosomonas sp.]|nr:MAG: 3',5'-cyclic-nucleotide phosphodiesterase [Nitrosomonas sp.]
MRLKILGCGGGIGGGWQTTAMLLDEDILIDAGTGVGSLSLDELIKIDHIFVTHAHMDHVAFIPFLVDTVGFLRDKPVVVHALRETLNTLQEHLFNWQLWPDFTKIPNGDRPYMRYEAIRLAQTVDLDDRKITPLPANHTVPAVGFHLDSGRASLVFSGDTTTNDALWVEINKISNLKYLIIESAFCDQRKDIAIRSKHFYPSLLATELEKLKRTAELYITHLKPSEAEKIMAEINQSLGKFRPQRLENQQVFEF